MYPINHLGRHWQDGPMVTIEDPASTQTEKIIATLFVPSRASGDGPSSARGHGVIMVLVRLDVGAKFKLTVANVVNLSASNNSTRTEGGRNPIGGRKCVKPKIACVYHFDYEAGGHAIEWERVVNTTNAFFHGSNVPFDIRQMLVIGDSIQGDLKLSQVPTD